MAKIKIKNIFKFLRKNWMIIGMLLVGAFLRLYRIDEYMTFLGDEGRDMIIVRRFLVNFDLMLIGPGTSVGNMYLGPLYYYLIAPSLFLANFSPVGPSVFVAVIGIATIFLVYWVGKDWFSKRAGLIASGLYAISPTIIIFSKSSWNPNIMPFFSLLSIYSIWRVWKKGRYFWTIICAVSFAFVLQSHYFGLLLLPLILLFWALAFFIYSTKSQEINDKAPVTKFIKVSLISLIVFLFLMSPLVIFDFRHNFMNFNAMKQFFVEKDTTLSVNIWSSVFRIPEILNLISTRLLAGRVESLGKIIVAVVSVPSILMLLGRKKLHKNEASGFSMLAMWMLAGLLGLGLYKHEIYDHYMGFLFASPFLFIGGFLDGVMDSLSRFGKGVLIMILGYVVSINLINSPVRSSSNMQMQRAENVAEKIGIESGGERFNLAVLAERNYEDGYGYFLEKEGYEVLHADIWNTNSISDQLFVVCEMPKEKCDPTHSPKAEVANFGWSKIESEWEISGVTIYKLIHSKPIIQ